MSMLSEDRIDMATAWLTATPVRQRPAPLIPHLRDTFDLTAIEAVEAIEKANLRRIKAT